MAGVDVRVLGWPLRHWVSGAELRDELLLREPLSQVTVWGLRTTVRGLLELRLAS